MRHLAAAAVALLFVSSTVRGGECSEGFVTLLESTDLSAARPLFDICKVEAERGDPEALYYLSFFYFDFPGMEPDPKKGVESVRASAEMGFGPAQYWMGWQHEMGTHLPRDLAAAASWYQKAAATNFSLARRRLVTAYRNGELGLPVDQERAQQYEGPPN